jgi:SAM-dependent methyltransferase
METPIKEANRIYSQPALYDMAFGYRGFEEEVDFLWKCHVSATAGNTPPRSILELAAGPGRHAMAALSLYGDELQAVYCVDSSPDMRDYATEIARQELPVDEQDKFQYQLADMRHFTLSTSVDTAWLLLGSLQHLTTNADVRQCLSSVHQCLAPGGTLVLELPHPRETFTMGECTRNGWKIPLEDEDGTESGELSIVWGDDDDVFDPVTQVRQFTVRMILTEPKGGGGTEEEDDDDSSLSAATPRTRLEEVVPMRLFTTQEIEALAFATGFQVHSLHGALEEGVTVDDEDASYRLVVVLQKDESRL